MDVLELARLQFAATTIYHFFFVPLSMGLSILLAVMHTMWYRTGNEKYERMLKFWGKLFLINFAMGVVTGIVQEFQFGMNWSEYSRFVGDIFGAPLAIEALMAFFIESTFLGIWIFGWDKISKKIHLASIWLVAFGSNISALWILIANSFMQNPVGYEMKNGRAQMTDFYAVVTNNNIFVQYPHVVLGALTTAAFFIVGVSAFRLLRQNDPAETAMFRTSLGMGLTVGLIAVFATMIFGHMSGQRLAEEQPMKLAASEALWEDSDPAGLSIFQIGDENERRELINISIPSILSFLTYDTPDGQVRGINSLQAEYEELYGPGNYVPPVGVAYWSFRAMVGSGVAMMLLATLGLFLNYRNQLINNKWIMRALMLSLFLPYIANSTGWMLTEIGRQPWIVQGLMRVEDAVSPSVDSTELLITLIGFVLIYGVLMAADVYLLYKYARGNSTNMLGDIETPDSSTKPAIEGAY